MTELAKHELIMSQHIGKRGGGDNGPLCLLDLSYYAEYTRYTEVHYRDINNIELHTIYIIGIHNEL